jgi:sec-independent protein translocase protein TatB
MLPDFGWTELLLIAIVLIVVVGPKDLPRVVRGFSKSLGSMRKMAGDFRKQFDDALSEAELDDLKTLASDVKQMDPRNKIKDALNPLGEIGKDINDELKGVAKSIEADAAPESSKSTSQEVSTTKKPAAKKLAASKPATKKPAAKPKAAAKTATSRATSSPVKKTVAAKPATTKKPAAKTTAPTKKPAQRKTPTKRAAKPKAGDA